MTQDEIIRMAREVDIPCFAGMYVVTEPSELERFAAIVAAHEREACAKVCEDYDSRTWMEHRFNMADEIAAAIRARGEK